MPTITINGDVLEFEGKKTILQVALDNGMALPHYCYHPGLSIVASCRICLAEVEAPNPRNDNKVELIPKMIPTCQHPAGDGMVVHTQSPKSIANQKAVMEFLLINHPLDCPVCDQAGECYLQDYSFRYGRGESRFEEDKIKNATKDVGPNVKLYSDRCIMCSRCVRFTREVTGTGELGVFGRGNREEIDVAPGKPLDNPLSGNVVDICPVGALLDKDFLFTQRVWNLTKTPSIDGITASGDNISIEHNDGRVYRFKPRTNEEVNKWWISDEIRYGWKFVHSEHRLLEPRVKGVDLPSIEESQPVDRWNAAYDAVADKLKSVGEGSLAVMVSPMLSCEDAFLLGALARAVDPKATLAVGPVPTLGEDQTLKGDYTIYAEKAPNRRGVIRALQLLDDDNVLTFEELSKKLSEGGIQTVLATGNYPSDWATDQVREALSGMSVILLDTLANDLTETADVVLPSVTWIEKAGTFENANERLQAFEQAIQPIEFGRSEAQVALDLLARLGHRDAQRYDAAVIRDEMGSVFISDVHYPTAESQVQSDMEYVQL